MIHQRSIPLWSARVTFTVGALVLLGWAFDVQWLKSIHPSWVTMKANTAVAFVLAGFSLSMVVRGRTAASRVLSGGVLLIGVATMLEYALGRSFGIDELLFQDPAPYTQTRFPGRPGWNSTLCMIVMGFALFVLPFRRTWSSATAQLLTLVPITFSSVAIAGYLYEAHLLYDHAQYSQIAFHTTLVWIVLSIGVIFSCPGQGIAKIILDDTLGGQMVRRLLPACVLIPTALGFFKVHAERAAIIDASTGTAAFWFLNLVTIVSIILLNGRSLSRIDRENRSLREGLERTVEERTLELQTKQKDLSDFVENANIGLHWVGPDGRILWVNRAELDMLGYAEEEYVGKKIQDFHADRPVIEDILARLGRDERIQNYEARLRCRDGSIRYASICSSVRWEGGQFIHTRCFTRDITEQKKAEEALKEKNQELEQFVHIASHDLQEPIRKILNYAEALESELSEEVRRDRIQRVRKAAERMRLLISGLLDFSRTDLSTKMRPVPLEELVRSVADDMDIQGQAELRIGALPTVTADPLLVRQLFQNLISNAVKFKKKDLPCLISVDGAGENGYHTVRVSDNGIGFDVRYLDKVFQPFQRLHADEYTGSGVGLAICRKIMKKHGGSITAEAAAGRGATFILYFPREHAATKN